MNGEFTLLVSKAGNSLKGKFSSTDFYSLTCPDIMMNLSFSKEEDVKREVVEEEKEEVAVKVTEPTKTAANVPVMPAAFRQQSAAEIQFPQRRNVEMGVIEVENDQLNIELIDNGEIDKDSVSIFFNGNVLANKLELTRRGIIHSISLDKNKASNEISMFAENLGIIPPNTAVLVVHDGAKRIEVSLTSTLQTNGTIRIVRKAVTVR